MLHTPGEEGSFFIGKGLFESLDSLGGGNAGSTPSQSDLPPQPTSPHFAQPHPQYHVSHQNRSFVLHEGPEGEDERAFGGGERYEQQSQQQPSHDGYRRRLEDPYASSSQGQDEGRSYQDGVQEGYPRMMPDPANFPPQQSYHNHHPSSPPSSHLQQPFRQQTLLPFPPEHDASRYPPPSPYYPPVQHALPPDPLYSAAHQAQSQLYAQQHQQQQQPQLLPSLHSQPNYPQRSQQYPQQLPPHLQQPQRELQTQQPPQHTIPLAMSQPFTLPVGVGGVNPMLGVGGKLPSGARFGARVGEAPQGGSYRAEIDEEISTIFVVGFPDDMQEREFQNMFTFCKDFEAATLKPPPTQGPNPPNTIASAAQALSLMTVSSDPSGFYFPPQQFLESSNTFESYNQDGQTSSTGAQSATPTRRQSIGFAKFRTRLAALEARDGLQGRKVDVEKGSVLKAEMAKKNLHTRRGVGGEEMSGGGNAGAGPGGAGGGSGANAGGVGGPPPGQAATRGRMDAFGSGGGGKAGGPNGSTAQSEWVNQLLVASTTQQPMNAQFSPFSAFDPSIPHLQHQAQPQFGQFPSQSMQDDRRPSSALDTDPASSPRYTPSSSQTEMPPPHQLNDPRYRPTEPTDFPLSPPPQSSRPVPIETSSQSFRDEDVAFSPPLTPGHPFSSSFSSQNHPSSPLPPSQSFQSRSLARDTSIAPIGRRRQEEPEQEEAAPEPATPVLDRASSGSSGGEKEEAGSGGGPNSTSSLSGKNAGEKLKSLPRTSNPADQNPPINTLYVGNLPQNPSTSQSPSKLEDALRTLFSRCEGFTRMSYRQKSNGPMCFVEFTDVPTASAAMKDLYGDTLRGFVKGGIRLSFSKHPLGQRGPAPPILSTNFSNSNVNSSSSPTLGFPPSSAGGSMPSNSSFPNPLASPPTFASSSPIAYNFPSSNGRPNYATQNSTSSSQSRNITQGEGSPPSTDYLSSSSLSHSIETSSGTSLSTSPPSAVHAPSSTSVRQPDWKGRDNSSFNPFNPFANELVEG